MTRTTSSSQHVTVVPFETRHIQAFRDLNIAWVERFFAIEAKDRELLDDPYGCIIAKGGEILIAENEAGTVVGCVALLPLENDEFELAKMAVDEASRGRGVGGKLIAAAIVRARALSARRLYLESNSKLEPAVRLYERSGFYHLSDEERPQSPYARCDVYMRLEL